MASETMNKLPTFRNVLFRLTFDYKKINFRQPICPSHLPICVDGDADQQVTGDGQEDDHSQEEAFEIISNKFFHYQKMLEMDNRVSTQTEVKFALGRGY